MQTIKSYRLMEAQTTESADRRVRTAHAVRLRSGCATMNSSGALANQGVRNAHPTGARRTIKSYRCVVTLAVSLVCAVSPITHAAGLSHEDQQQLVHEAVRVAKQISANDRADVYDRILVAGALAETGDADSLDFLKQYLANSDFVLKRSAIDTLMSSSHPSELDLLFRTASNDPQVLGFMVESLVSTPRADMDDVLGDALKGDSLYVRKNALQAIARGEVVGLKDEVEALVADPHTDATIKAYGYYALARNGKSAQVRSQVMDIAEKGEVEAREVAVIALGLMDDKDTKALLSKLSKGDGDQRVSLAALASSAGLGDDESIGRLIHGIAYGKAMEQAVLAGSLKRLPAAKAAKITDILMTCCKLTPDAATRVLESWSTIQADPTKVYAWGLGNEQADVRLQTVWLVGHRKDLNALHTISALLKDKDPAIRAMAAWSIIHTAGSGYVGGGTET